MIVILSKKEVAKVIKMKLTGKGDKEILAQLTTGSKFDMRLDPKDFSEEKYPKINMGEIIAEVRSKLKEAD